MQLSKHIFIGAGVATIATALLSFSGTPSKKLEDETKKKKYHIIHQKDGVMYEYDTIIPVNSNYSVEDFLAEKGIEDENPKIIEIPAVHSMEFMTQEAGEAKVFMHHLDEEVMIHNGEGKNETVKIIREEDEKGNVTMKKFVNGEEVEVTEEDLNNIHHHGTEGHHAIIIKDTEGDFEWTEEKGEHNVEMKVEVDDEGNMKVQKFVNGEEVEVSEEEMDEIEKGHGNVFIIQDSHEGDINIDMDSLMETIEMKIEMVEGEDLNNGESRVIIKEIHVDDEEISDDSKEVRKEIRMEKHVEIDAENSKDFTLVLVHENYDESMEEHMEMRIISDEDEMNDREGVSLNEPISVYPNPNSGTFTITFNQKDELKTSVRVVDAQGKVVFKDKLGNFSGAYKKELDLKKHGIGTFIVTVQQGEETSSRKVIVK